MFGYLNVCFALTLQMHHSHGRIEHPGAFFCLWIFGIQQLVAFSPKSFSVLSDDDLLSLTCIDKTEFTPQALQPRLFLSRNREKQFLLALYWSEYLSEIEEIGVQFSSSWQG